MVDKASDLEVKKLATATTAPLSGLTTTSVKIAKQRGKSTSNSPQSAEKMTLVEPNFHLLPPGAAVLYLNDFHHGEHLPLLNKIARYCPWEIRHWSNDIALTHDGTARHVEIIIDLLRDTMEQKIKEA